MIKEWPWWIAIVIATSCVGILFGYFAIKRLMIRQNERRFVQNVINEAEAFPEKDPEEESYNQSQKEAELQWKESIAKLKKSHLRKFGNPLYVLPWYIVMGESRSGKTSAIKNANLSSALTDVGEATIISGTKNCDWWFLEQAVVLDTAGRYTIPIQEEKDKKEWQGFLTLLSKYRKKEPINGVVITIASDALLNEDATQLRDKAKSIRQRINQMMRIMGARFPVYLLVTKMDLVNGFTDFCDHIPDKREGQVMGYANTTGQTDGMQVLEECMTTIFDQIRDLRTVFVHNRINSFAISFSNEFMNLKSGMESYVSALFGDDIYQATPLFRGIYFSSACRKGEPTSEFLDTVGITYNNETKLNPNDGFFLKGFFSAILPKDRNVFTPLSEFLMWRKTTLSLGIFSFVLICLAISGVLAFSYFNNVKAIKNFDAASFTPPSLELNIPESILLLDRQKFEIEKLAISNKGWMLPRLGLNQSLTLEENLKQNFVQAMEKNIVDPIAILFFEKISQINSLTSYDDMVDSSVYAIRKINALNEAIQGKLLTDQKEFETSIETLFPTLDPGISPDIASKFAGIYYSYLTWKDDHSTSIKKLEQFQKVLSQLAVKGNDFNWLLSHKVCSTPNVEISAFLKGYKMNSSMVDSKSHLRGAFTRAGRQEIEEFIEMIQNPFYDPEAFSTMEKDFWVWYANEFYRAWFDFASTFPTGSDWKTLADDWTDLGTLMTSDQNPYFNLLDKMGAEFKWFKSHKDLEPSWAATVLALKEIKQVIATDLKKEQGSFMTKLSLEKDKISEKLKTSAEKTYYPVIRNDAADVEYKLEFTNVWNAYAESLKSLSSVISYNEKCFHMFSDFFKDLSDPSKQQEPFSQTYEDLINLNSFLGQADSSPLVQHLMQGPFDFLCEYGIHQSSLYLQNKWEEIVLNVAFNIDPDQYYSVLFDKNTGIIWQFVNEEASIFITQNKIGFLPKTSFGFNLPFSNSFFELLNKGEQLSLDHQDEYTVSITTLPVDVNNEATIRPFSNTLTMECAHEKTELLNNNFPETQKFTWRPEVCGDAVLQVQFEGATLQKKYSGRLGFPRFLMDFQDGTKIFNIMDFPDQAGYLANNNVTDIKVAYQINGIEPVLKFFNRRPPVIPEGIFKGYRSKGDKYPIAPRAPEKSKKQTPGKEIRLKDSYSLVMATLPIGVNPSARIKPVAAILWTQCGDKVIRFENNNYPESLKFDWEPANCGKVVLTIKFPEFSLLKEYQTFYEFLKDFNSGSRTFISDEFPEQRDALLKNGISAVTLSYDFTGDLPLVQRK